MGGEAGQAPWRALKQLTGSKEGMASGLAPKKLHRAAWGEPWVGGAARDSGFNRYQLHPCF